MKKMEEVLDANEYILGKEVDSFENAFALYSGVKHAIGVSNGTDALKLCLKTLHIGKGDEVILPANTFISTALAVSDVGATPILTEPDAYTYNLSEKNIGSLITSKTKAIIPVHLYGQVCPMDNIMSLAIQNSLYVIEDNAQAQGASIAGKLTGSFGHINATSFYPSKNLGALGDAGAITTSDDDLHRKAALLRNLGSKKKYQHEVIGYNARLDNLQAAFLSVKLNFLDQWNQERIRLAQYYIQQLQHCSDIILPNHTLENAHVFHLFVIRTNERNGLQRFLEKKQIQTLIHYPTPIHLQPAFDFLGYKKGAFPITETLSNSILSLPLYIGMTEDEINYVCENIIQFYK